jgi:hypothetical protein
MPGTASTRRRKCRPPTRGRWGFYEVGTDEEDGGNRADRGQGGCRIRTCMLLVRMMPPEGGSRTGAFGEGEGARPPSMLV